MEFIREHRVQLSAYILLLTEVFLFRNSLLPPLAMALMLAVLIIKVLTSEMTLRAERLINVISVGIVITVSAILIIQAL